MHLTIDLTALASAVHGAVAMHANGEADLETSALLATWDVLLANPDGSDVGESLRLIHEQVDAVLNGDAQFAVL